MLIKQFEENDVMLTKLDEKITYQTLFTDANGSDTSFLSYTVKEIGTLLLMYIFPIIFLSLSLTKGFSDTPVEYRPRAIIGYTLIMLIMIFSTAFFIIMKRHYRSKYLNKFRTRIVIVVLLEISAISYASIVLFKIFPSINYFLLLFVLISYLAFSLWLVKIILVVDIKKTLNKSYGQNIQISKFANYLNLYPGLVLAVVIFGMYFYRSTKAVFIVNHTDPATLIYSVVGSFGYLLIALSISLLPTILFDGELYVRGKLLQNHPEHFRKEYEFTEEEWYGEDWNGITKY